MNKITFIIGDSIKSLVKSWKMNAVLVCTLYGAMILSIFCLSSIRFLQDDLEKGRYTDIDESIESGFIGGLLSQEEKTDIVRKSQAEKGSIAAREKLYFPSLNNKSYFVIAIDRFFENYEQIKVTKGRTLHFHEGQYECVIGAKLAEEQNLSVNDYVEIAGRKFKIAGITAQGQYKRYFILSYFTFAQLEKSSQVQQTLYLTGRSVEKGKVQDILSSMESSEHLYSELAATVYQQNKEIANRWIHIRELTEAVSLLFATFNILAVCFGKIQELRKKYLIKKMLGLTELGVFLSFLVENLCVILIADIMVYVSFYPLASLIGVRDVILVDNIMLGETVGLSVFLAFVYAIVLALYLSRCSMPELLREGD